MLGTVLRCHMTSIKPNTEVIRKALKGERGRVLVDGHAGLCLYARGDGNGSWMLRYRIGGKQHWHTLHNDAARAVLSEVIEAKDRFLADVKLRGVNPKAEARAAAAKADSDARTLEAAYLEWLDHPGRKRRLSERTRKGYDDLFALHIMPRLGDKALASIDRDEIERFLEAVRMATTDAERGHRGLQATKCRTILHAIFKYGVRKRWAPLNPVEGTDLPVPLSNPEGKASRPATDDELRRVWLGADEGMGINSARVLRLALLLGRRVSEIVGARRDELRLDGREPTWTIPAGREGNKAKAVDIVPLPRLAARIFRDAIAAAGESPFVFPARGKPNTSMSRHTPSSAFTEFRRAIGIEDAVRFHDSRGLLNDRMAAMRVPSEYRSRVLHHTGDIRSTLANSVYSEYEFLPEKRRALRLWQMRLRGIVSGRRQRELRW